MSTSSRYGISTPLKPRILGELALATSHSPANLTEASISHIHYEGTNFAETVIDTADFDQCRFRNITMASELQNSTFSHCEFAASDFANLAAGESSLLQSSLTGCRATGLSWASGIIRDVSIDASTFDLSAFRYTLLKKVIFRDCNLQHVDFQRATFEHVVFQDCDLSGAQFGSVELNDVRFINCLFADIGGVSSLRGAHIEGGDILGLATCLAREAGIHLH